MIRAALAQALAPALAPALTLVLALTLTVALAACSGTPPALPSPPPEAGFTFAPTAYGLAAPDPPRLRDRAALRTGFACADCHRLGAEDAALRGGPDLPPRGDAADPSAWAPAVARCLERYGATPGDAPERLAHLLAALRDLPVVAPAPPKAVVGPNDARALWRQACAHCHDAGLGPDLHRRPWPAARLVAAVRGTDRPRHPKAQMPTFSAERISDAALSDLAVALEAGGLGPAEAIDEGHAPTLHPEVGNGEGQ